jgi:hypothetical protein
VNIQWDPDALWQKTRLFAARAESEEQEGPLFPLWSIFALELLGRTVVANIHPALLADPQNPESLLYTFGLGQPDRPRSVPAATVFRRCSKIIDEFTEADLKGALALIDLRNEELHSGGTPFEGLKTAAWLANYYRLCQLLLGSLGRGLGDLFGSEQAGAAEQMVAGAAEQLESEVKQYVASQRRAFDDLSEDEQAVRRESSALAMRQREREAWAPNRLGKTVNCPACGGPAWLTGEFVRSGEPIADEDAIVQEIVKIPTGLECLVCGLQIAGHGRLHALGLGGLFTGQVREDPASYFGIEFEPSEEDLAKYFEPDYGNE